MHTEIPIEEKNIDSGYNMPRHKISRKTMVVHYGIYQPSHGEPHTGAEPLLFRDPSDRPATGWQDDHATEAGEERKPRSQIRDPGRPYY